VQPAELASSGVLATETTEAASSAPQDKTREQLQKIQDQLFAAFDRDNSDSDDLMTQSPMVQKEAAANNIGVHAGPLGEFVIPEDEGDIQNDLRKEPWMMDPETFDMESFGERPRDVHAMKWFADGWKIDLSTNPAICLRYARCFRFMPNTQGLRTPDSLEDERELLQEVLDGWDAGQGKWFMQQVANSEAGTKLDIDFTALYGPFQIGDLQMEHDEGEDDDFEEIVRATADSMAGKSIQQTFAEKRDLSMIPNSFWEVPSDALEMYDRFDYIGALEEFLSSEDCQWNDTRDEYFETPDELGEACPLTWGYMTNMMLNWNELGIDLRDTQPPLVCSGRELMENAIRCSPSIDEILRLLMKGPPYSLTAHPWYHTSTSENSTKPSTTTKPKPPAKTTTEPKPTAKKDKGKGKAAAPKEPQEPEEEALPLQKKEIIPWFQKKILETLPEYVRGTIKSIEPGKTLRSFKITLADSNVISVKLDAEGNAIDPKESSLNLTPSVVKAVAELKRVSKDPKMQYRGRLCKKKLLQNDILAPHFTKTRGSLRTDSPLAQFKPEELGFDPEFWKYLRTNIAHHAEHHDGNTKVDGSASAYRRNQNQERGGNGRFGSKISPLRSNGVFDPSTPGLHPLNAKYAVLQAMHEGKITAKHLNMQRLGSRYSEIISAATAWVNRGIQIERWQNQERKNMSLREGVLKHEVAAGQDVQQQQTDVIDALKQFIRDNGLVVPPHLDTSIATRKKLPRWLTPKDDKRERRNMVGKGLSRPVLQHTARRKREADEESEEEEEVVMVDDPEPPAEDMEEPGDPDGPVPTPKTPKKKTPKTPKKQIPKATKRKAPGKPAEPRKRQKKKPFISDDIVPDDSEDEGRNINDFKGRRKANHGG
jgi:hypothetical protein